jgi:hypothetical protein
VSGYHELFPAAPEHLDGCVSCSSWKKLKLLMWLFCTIVGRKPVLQYAMQKEMGYRLNK